MFFSIVVPVFNAEKYVLKTLNALLDQDFNKNCYEIIMVNDGSSDSTASLLSGYSDKIILINQKNAGPAAARNSGARAARGEIIVFTDSDTIPEKDWLKKLSEPFKNPAIKACAGTYSNANKSFFLSRLIQNELKTRYARFSNFIRFAGTYNLAVRKPLFDEIGGFDTTYLQASGEDNDFCYKIVKSGNLIKFVADARVAHFHTSNIFKYLKEQFRHGFWRAKLYLNYPERLSGDDYTYWKDILESLISTISIIASMLLPLLSPKNELFRKLSFFLLILLSVLASLELHSSCNLHKDAFSITLTWLILFLRAFARSSGFICGIIAIIWK
jgi:cellulose synthase/poly-beta-1,6-N-acetylglucosamine synthase-like glycosyltransferase